MHIINLISFYLFYFVEVSCGGRWDKDGTYVIVFPYKTIKLTYQSDLFFFVFFFSTRKLSYLLDQHGNDGDKDGTFVAVSMEN